MIWDVVLWLLGLEFDLSNLETDWIKVTLDTAVEERSLAARDTMRSVNTTSELHNDLAWRMSAIAHRRLTSSLHKHSYWCLNQEHSDHEVESLTFSVLGDTFSYASQYAAPETTTKDRNVNALCRVTWNMNKLHRAPWTLWIPNVVDSQLPDFRGPEHRKNLWHAAKFPFFVVPRDTFLDFRMISVMCVEDSWVAQIKSTDTPISLTWKQDVPH